MEMARSVREKMSVRKASSAWGWAKKPAPFPLATTVPEGQPRFRLTSAYPRSWSTRAAARKASAWLASSWGTTGTPWLWSGWRSDSPRPVMGLLVVGAKKGA